MNPKRIRNFWIILVIMAIPYVLFGCTSDGNGEPASESISPTEIEEAPTETQPAMAEEIEQPEPVPTEIPLVEVYQINNFQDIFGTYRVVGLVRNNSDQVVNNIKVDVTIFDANDRFIYAETASTSLYTLMPGETTPFVLMVFQAFPNAAYATGSVLSHGTDEIERADVDIQGVTTSIDNANDVHITGELYNGNPDPIQINSMAGAIFTKDGELLTANTFSVASQYLDPGEKGTFRITMTGSDEGAPDFSDYQIFIDAENTNPEDYYDISFSEPPSYYIDQSDWFHLVGEITNNSDEFLNIELLAAVYDDAGNVIDVAETDLPVYSLAPGETLPYDFSNWGPINFKDGLIDSAVRFSVQWDPFWTEVSDTAYVELLTENDTQSFEEFYGTFTGQVVNNSGEDLVDVVIIIGLYDDEGNQIFAMSYESLDELPAGESADYEVFVDIQPDFDLSDSQIFIAALGELPK